jgi:hypothetical protein
MKKIVALTYRKLNTRPSELYIWNEYRGAMPIG